MKFHIEDEYLQLTMEGAEMVLALKRRLLIPHAAIERAVWHEQFVSPGGSIGLRIGTGLPGILYAGTFVSRAVGRSFLYMVRPKGLFGEITADHILELWLVDHPYRRVLVTVDDPAMAQQIVAWAQQR